METPEERAWRKAYQSGMPSGSDACPGDETLAALVLGELSGDERASLARHVSECRRCAESYRTLRALHAETHSEMPRRSMRRRAVAAAAILAAALGATLVWFGRGTAPTDSSVAVRSDKPLEEMVEPVDGAVLDAAPVAFSWPAQPGATGYRVRVYDEAATLFLETPHVADPSVVPEADALVSLGTGGAFFWTVEVGGPAPRSLLGPFWFHIGE